MSIISKTDGQHNDLSQKLSSFCKSFGVYILLRRFGAEKVRGVSFQTIFDFLFALVFSGRNFYSTQNASLSKDVVYRFLNNAKIHWERILLFVAVSVIVKIRVLTDTKRLTAILIDDSPYSRNRSKKVELLSKVYDHAAHAYFMGFRLLTMGFSDGNTFIPFAKQLMSSVKTKFDSWFSNPVTLMTIKKIGYFCVAMLKKNKIYYLFQNEKKTICQIYNSIKKRPGRSKYLAVAHIMLVHKDFEKPLPAVIVFVRDKANKKKWCAIISTDTALSAEQIIELYGKRWDIEVFFKMCRSYLKLAKEFEGRSYDMMTAHTTIVFLRYICLAWEQRQSQDPRCFGELFFLVSDELEDISFAQALETLLIALLET